MSEYLQALSLVELYRVLSSFVAELQSHLLRCQRITCRGFQGRLRPYLCDPEDCNLATLQCCVDLWPQAAKCKLAIERFIYPCLGIDNLKSCGLSDDEPAGQLLQSHGRQPLFALPIWGFISQHCPQIAAALRERFQSFASEPVPAESPPTNAALSQGGDANLPAGFLGGEQLAQALGVPPERRQTFLRALGRLRKPKAGKRAQLPDTDWQEVQNFRQNTPKFLYRLTAPAVQETAERFRKTVGQKRPTTARREKIMQRKLLRAQHFSGAEMSAE